MRSILFLSGLLLSSSVLANSTDPQALTAQVKALWQAGDAQAAQALLAPLVTKKTKDARLLALLGHTEALLNNADKAEGLLEKAVKLDSNNADYQHWYATVSCNLASSASMLSALGYAKRCKKAYEAALKLAPENPRSYIALGSFLAQAPGIAGGDRDEASKMVAQLKELDQLQGELLQLRVSDLADDASFKQLLAETELLSTRPELYFQRAMQFAHVENYRDAIGALQQALSQPAADDDAVASQAESRYQLGRIAVLSKTAVAEGIAAMQQYLAQTPDKARIDWANLRLAQLHLLADDKAKADAILQPLLAATTDDKLKAELKKLL